jgi:hypothetical protein
MKSNFRILKVHLIILIVLQTAWLFYNLYLISKDLQDMLFAFRLLIFLSISLISYGIFFYVTTPAAKQWIMRLVVSLTLMQMGFNLHNHLDMVGTRTPNPNKTLPYYLAIEHYLVLMIMTNLVMRS